MPENIQDLMVHSLPGLENAKILKYAYAIEYDALDPTQFDSSLMVKKWPGLFIAGQICGTSGYEEAAGLGIMAGINAGNWLKGIEPFVLKRDEAYIGVMIDDLITKGTKEPYRLLSSRAEYRLLLRSDNADMRLTEYGHKYGLINEERYSKFLDKKEKIEAIKKLLKEKHFGTNSKVNDYLVELGYTRLDNGISATEILKRNNVNYHRLKDYLDIPSNLELTPSGEEELEVSIKYEGYINEQRREANKLRKLEEVKLSSDIDYKHMDGLALEARQKLAAVQPKTIGQASRISGVNPSDIAVLILYLKRDKKL